MIIWGWKGVTSTKRKGSFFCPQCECERTFAHKSVRRFFTLYFIPIIPLQSLGEFVECSFCRGSFQTTVLSHDPRAQQEKLDQMFKAALGAMVIQGAAHASGGSGQAQRLREVLAEKCGIELTIREVSQRLGEKVAATTIVEPIGGSLNENGRELLFRAALLGVGIGGGGDTAGKYLGEVSAALGLSTAHVRGILSEGSEPE